MILFFKKDSPELETFLSQVSKETFHGEKPDGTGITYDTIYKDNDGKYYSVEMRTDDVSFNTLYFISNDGMVSFTEVNRVEEVIKLESHSLKVVNWVNI